MEPPAVAPGNSVAAITEIYAHASTFPCKVETQEGAAWVMKLRGSGPGPMALLTEFLALRAANAAGLSVPEVMPLYLPEGFPWTIGTDEFDGIVQRSYGWNLGIAFVADARPAAAQAIHDGQPEFLAALADMDRALANMDRSARNPNVLETPSGLVAIDFDACLFLRRAVRNVVPSTFELPADHLCAGHAINTPRHKLDTGAMIAALRSAPPEWIVSLDLTCDQLEARIAAYAAAWNGFIPRET